MTRRMQQNCPWLHMHLLWMLLSQLVLPASSMSASLQVVQDVTPAQRLAQSPVQIPARAALPLHLQDDFRTEITLRGAVLHSSPFAIVERDPTTGDLSARGLQIDLLERLPVFAARDNVSLKFELQPFQYSPDHTYSKALDWIANDCRCDTNTTSSNSTYDNDCHCNSFDLVIADYWSTAERYLRVDFTPPWLSNAISAMKYKPDPISNNNNNQVDIDKQDITTLTEASQVNATVCVLKGTHSSKVVMDKFPAPNYLQCHTDEECFQHLQYGRCVLFSRDELFLQAKEFEDPNFVVTRERFNTQYVVWPMTYDLPPVVSYLLKRWIIQAVGNTTMDQLYYKYFEKELCPIGTAGENCGLYCDPSHGASDSHGACICVSTKWTGGKCYLIL